MRTITSIQDVVDWGLCVGCGTCASACDQGGVELINIESVGIRPRFTEACSSCTKCLAICPGFRLDAPVALPLALPDESREVDAEIGQALEIWEGYAADPDIRHAGSSGGLLTALALHCLEREGMGSVVHSEMHPDQPWVNRTARSRTRAELLARTGSRYAPASPGDGLRDIENGDHSCVFIGKPCDAAGAMMLSKTRPALDRNLGLVMTFFCAGTPSSKGTLELSESLGIQKPETQTIRYRGEGWPGEFKVISNNGGGTKTMSYSESWGRLTSYRPFRCNICPDGLGRVADIACGDAWENYDQAGADPGRSIVIVRTERGRAVLHRAIAAGYVELVRIDAGAVLKAQENLLQRRREIFGRMLALRLFLVPTPHFRGYALARSWWKLATGKKLRTVLGTARRIVQRGNWRKRKVL